MGTPDGAAYYGYNFGIRVSVWRHLEVGWELDAQDHYLPDFRRVAYECRDLYTLRKCRIALPCKSISRSPRHLPLRNAKLENAIKATTAIESSFMLIPPCRKAPIIRSLRQHGRAERAAL